MSEQADGDLGREADREDVELRHDARDDAERGVGEHERRAARGAQTCERAAEDRRERDLDALDERADLRARSSSGTSS